MEYWTLVGYLPFMGGHFSHMDNAIVKRAYGSTSMSGLYFPRSLSTHC